MSTIAPPSRTSGSAEQALDTRVRFRRTSVPGFVGGGWWPQSTDLAAEIPALVRAARASGRAVFRVLYSLDAWERPPRTVMVDGAAVKLGGYRSVDPSVVTLVDPSGWQREDVVVVPPDTDPAFAASALESASSQDNHRALEILAARPTAEAL